MSDPDPAGGAGSAVVLARFTSLQVGGPAPAVFEAGDPEGIRAVLTEVGADHATSLTVLGGGTNVIISDDGLAGPVLRVAGGSIEWSDLGDGIVEATVDAGVDWDRFVEASVDRDLTGVELMSGIPGSVGASPIQNIGAYGQQVADVIDRVEAIDRADLSATTLPAAACGFGFRHSRFKAEWRDRYVVTRVHLRLRSARANPPTPSTYVDIARHFEGTDTSPTDVTARRDAVLATRRTKSMLLDPADPDARSVGSFFINPTVPTALAVELATRFRTLGLPVHYLEGHGEVPPERTRIPAAHVLRASGFHPGDSWGPVGLSSKHVLAMVTRPGATATDVWNVGHAIRSQVRTATGVDLNFEATFVGEFPPFDATRFDTEYPYVAAPDVEPDWLKSYRSN